MESEAREREGGGWITFPFVIGFFFSEKQQEIQSLFFEEANFVVDFVVKQQHLVDYHCLLGGS